jgi:hypothetical protein
MTEGSVPGLEKALANLQQLSSRRITSLNADLSNKETSAHLAMKTTFENSANGPLLGRAQANRQKLQLFCLLLQPFQMRRLQTSRANTGIVL